MKVLFACQHLGTVQDGKAPLCACGERRVVRALVGAPRIVGTASGPHVTTQALGPISPMIGESTLTLKTETANG